MYIDYILDKSRTNANAQIVYIRCVRVTRLSLICKTQISCINTGTSSGQCDTQHLAADVNQYMYTPHSLCSLICVTLYSSIQLDLTLMPCSANCGKTPLIPFNANCFVSEIYMQAHEFCFEHRFLRKDS